MGREAPEIVRGEIYGGGSFAHMLFTSVISVNKHLRKLPSLRDNPLTPP